VNNQTIGLIATAVLAGIGLIGYIVLTALDKDTSGLQTIIGGLGLATLAQGAAILKPGGGSSSGNG
jgi:hypothetical protein